MFNLLPEKLKAGIRKDYLIRRIVVICAFLIFIGAVFLIFLFPSWIVSVYKEREMSRQFEENNSGSLSTKVKEVALNIRQLNEELKTIDTALRYEKIIPLINTILAERNRSIFLSEITYDATDFTNSSILLEGVSGTRASLLAFVKSLEESKAFKSVDIPISNFTKEKNITFSIKLSLVKPNEEK